MHREGLGGGDPVRHKSRRPRLRVGNATPSRGEGVPERRKRPCTILLRYVPILSIGPISYTPLSRRCHFQDPQYHFLGPRVSVGKVNVYKVEARLNRDLTVSRPWHIFVLLTEVDTRLLCAINHSPVASGTSLSHEPDKQCVPTPASTRSTIATTAIVARAAQAAS